MGQGLRKLLLGILVVAVPAVFLFLGVRGYVVRNAVVTAEITTVRSPIDGQVTANPLYAGLPADGQTGIAIRNPRSDPRALDSLTGELAQLLRSIENQQALVDWLDKAVGEAEGRLRATLSGMALDLHLEHEIVLAQIKAREARVAYLAAQYERAQRLQGTAASQATLDATEADLEETRAEIESLNVKAEQLEQRRSFLDQGLPLSEIADHATILSDRIQDMKVERQIAATTLSGLEGQLDVLRGRLESEQRTYDLLTHFAQAPPASAVVWEVFLAAGATVGAGATVYTYVDCSQRFVEVTVGDATSELLQPRHRVRISLSGQSETVEGQVTAVFGSAAGTTLRRTMAAHVAEAEENDAIVLIALPPADETSRSYRLCDIGRTAYVEFEGIGFLDPLLNRLF
jgi:multidrug efflux pump subunit AcrA (membrane-fusion protein)